MFSGVGLVISAGCGFVLVVMGGAVLLSVPTKNKQEKSVRKILSKRVFREISDVKKELSDYFSMIVGRLNKANFCFTVAFIVLSLTIKAMNPDISIFGAMARLLYVAWIPFVIIGVIKYWVMNLCSNSFEKLNEDQ
ncbi:MAG: hypothetical protein WD989_01470 [Candidatus Paceibacterota bacterium]